MTVHRQPTEFLPCPFRARLRRLVGRACLASSSGFAGSSGSSGLAGLVRFAGSAVLAGFLAAFLTSCEPADPPLRVGLPPWIPAEFALLARDLGSFDDREIELVQYTSPIELARHFREGSLDAAALTLDFAPYWASSLRSLDVVFVTDISQGADDVLATAQVGTLAGLRGRRVGFEASPLGAHMLLRALQAGGLATRDIEPVSLDSEDQAAAFASGRVDAVVAHEPVRSRLLSGGASSLFDSSRVPGQVVSVLVVSSVTSAKHSDALRKLIDGWLAAYQRLLDNRATTVAKLASRMSTDAGGVEKVLAGVRLAGLALNRELLGGASPRLASTMHDIESLAVDGGLLPADHAGRVRFNDSFLPNIVSRPFGGAMEPGAR